MLDIAQVLPRGISTTYVYFSNGWPKRALPDFRILTLPPVLEFQQSLRQRKGTSGKALSSATMQRYHHLFVYLYRFGGEIGDGLEFDPFPGQSSGRAARKQGRAASRLPYTPEHVAAVLIEGAIKITSGVDQILLAIETYQSATSSAIERGCGQDACTNAANKALSELASQAKAGVPICSVGELAEYINMLYAACFVLISYLVGPRASEILHLRAGCVRVRDDDIGEPVTIIKGAIFKRQTEYFGREHEWVAPPMAVKAIRILEQLSSKHRQQARSDFLWLRRGKIYGATEWQVQSDGTLAIMSMPRVRSLLSRFANWLSLPKHEGEEWRLSTHQGRKTFARFAALRDRSSLFALAQHFGHRERSVTDQGYAGSDYRLNEEIDAAIVDHSVLAWEQMLAAPILGGAAGQEIVAKRPSFQGTRLKQDLKSYARLLVDAGLVLGVCDWGFCVYREEQSACLGNALGPNASRREPSTCVKCKNFVVTQEHRPYWLGQLQRSEGLLAETALPIQTLRLVRKRVDEARSMLKQIDSNLGEDLDGE